VLVWIAFQIRRDGLFRPFDGKIFGLEKMSFVFLQWPWVLWGCLMAVRDRLTGRFVDFRVTPKGAAAEQKLPVKLVLVYAMLSAGAILPVLLVRDVEVARGFHLLSGLNALIYAAIVTFIVLGHLTKTAALLKHRWQAALTQVASVTALIALVGTALVQQGAESLYALSIGMEPFQIARAEFSASGAGMGRVRRIHFHFDPGWNGWTGL
ncbi:MAG: N-acetylglucosaminyltransferase, partial [Rhodobacteraceae bacterium]|nr:N-acetylglucosaminyltransferase [Paracoccaceae bacterium]